MHRNLWTSLLLVALTSACGSGSSRATVSPTQAAATVTPAAAASLAPSPSSTAVATRAPAAVAVATTVAPKPLAIKAASPSPQASPASRHASVIAASTAPSGSRRRFPVQGCKVSYGHTHHDYPATDIFAARGCAVVSPVTGRVDEVSTVDRWSSTTNRGADRGGLSFSIVGDDGVRYYGSHLQTIHVRPGQRILAGASIGTVGNSGSARGIATHLHFGLSWPTRAGVWWVRRGEVYPWPYLDSWRAGGNRSPVAAVAAEHRRQGTVPPCRIDC